VAPEVAGSSPSYHLLIFVSHEVSYRNSPNFTTK
jgi:hypothetical protein